MTKLIDLYNDIINLEDDRRAVNTLYLHFRKIFDCVPQDPHKKKYSLNKEQREVD